MIKIHSLANSLEEFIYYAEKTMAENTDSPEFFNRFIQNLKDLKSLCVSLKQFKANMSGDLTEEEIEQAIKPMFDKYLDTLK